LRSSSFYGTLKIRKTLQQTYLKNKGRRGEDEKVRRLGDSFFINNAGNALNLFGMLVIYVSTGVTAEVTKEKLTKYRPQGRYFFAKSVTIR
jgi:hypothetical protein